MNRARLRAGLSISPLGKSFGSAYHLSFDVWSNFNGAANSSGLADNGNSEGGTNNVLMAVGTHGTSPLVVGNTGAVTNSTIDGVAFATTGDGGMTPEEAATWPLGKPRTIRERDQGGRFTPQPHRWRR